MTELKHFLSGQSKDPANDLEKGVALLLSLFRFSVIHYGLIPTLRDGPDLLAFTQNNELLVIDVRLDCQMKTTRSPNLSAGQSEFDHPSKAPGIRISKRFLSS